MNRDLRRAAGMNVRSETESGNGWLPSVQLSRQPEVTPNLAAHDGPPGAPASGAQPRLSGRAGAGRRRHEPRVPGGRDGAWSARRHQSIAARDGPGVSIDRFRREIQLAAALQHPHIVPLLHAGHVGEVLYYTMPLIEGESLRTKLARDGALPIADSVRILRDVVDALAYAHRYGVAHRDIKPDNVLISAHHAVVTDFGVAKALGEATGETSLTSVGVTLGTPAYMAPEQ